MMGEDNNNNDKDEKNRETNINDNNNVMLGGSVVGGGKAKSCKGCMYYTSLHKSKSQSPSCYGLSKTFPHVSRQLVREMELAASKDGHDLKKFKYACIGHSIYWENQVNTPDMQNKPVDLPLCAGLKVLMKRCDSSGKGHVHPHKAEDIHAKPQPRTNKPTGSGEDVFLNRFKRNANLVASGVAKNIDKVATHVKETFNDIVYPYRRPPK